MSNVVYVITQQLQQTKLWVKEIYFTSIEVTFQLICQFSALVNTSNYAGYTDILEGNLGGMSIGDELLRYYCSSRNVYPSQLN